MADKPSLAFACPRCGTPLEQGSPGELCCPKDGLRFTQAGGIWHMLLPEREPLFAQFRREYEAVRRAEGRGGSLEYYRALPERDLTGRMPGDWQVRRASFSALIKNVLNPLEDRAAQPLRILDLGAGNGWLSNRLAQRGHTVAAVDLADNDFDGLGCYRYYASSFTPVQAEFDHLPFVAGTVDLVIFNASLHYSTDYAVTLGEAYRVLAPQRLVAVMDSPVYNDPSSGAQMVQERKVDFLHKYNFASDALPSENYLTYRRVGELAAALGLNVRRFTPSYSLQWRLRPLKARLLGQREPAKFHLILFSKPEKTPSHL